MIDALKQSTFFSGFDDKALADIAGFATFRNCEAGQVLFDRDDACNSVYMVRKGRVRQGFEVSPGTMVWFQTAEPGALIGLNALIPPRVHNMRAVASEKSEIIVIDAGKLADYLEQNTHFGYIFMERLAQLLLHRLNNCRLQVIHLMPTKEDDGPRLAMR